MLPSKMVQSFNFGNLELVITILQSKNIIWLVSGTKAYAKTPSTFLWDQQCNPIIS